MHQYGGMPAPLAALGVVVLSMAMALYGALALALTRWLRPPESGSTETLGGLILSAFTFASAWTLFEWLRGTLFTGFPWLNIGYAHIEGMFAYWAPVVGVYGIAWMAAFSAAALAQLALARQKGRTDKAPVVLALAIILGMAGVSLQRITWSTPYGPPLLVRLVQGNVPQSEKFDPLRMQRGIENYLQLANLPPKAPDAKPDVIILPETVVPLFQNRVALQLWQQWLRVAKEQDATLLLGAPISTARNGREIYTNSVIGLDAATPLEQIIAGTPGLRYDKHHLVPFGEFIPTGFRWFIDMMSIPLGDFDRGSLQQRPFSIGGQRIALNICYEDLFGEEIAQAVNRPPEDGGATLLVNVSNLAWFGDSWALRQHLQIARMRSLETSRPMLRATNTGSTAAIDTDGTVRAVLTAQQPGVLDVEVQGASGLTPYVRWGNLPVVLFSMLVLGLALGRRQSTAGRSSHP